MSGFSRDRAGCIFAHVDLAKKVAHCYLEVVCAHYNYPKYTFSCPTGAQQSLSWQQFFFHRAPFGQFITNKTRSGRYAFGSFSDQLTTTLVRTCTRASCVMTKGEKKNCFNAKQIFRNRDEKERFTNACKLLRMKGHNWVCFIESATSTRSLT